MGELRNRNNYWSDEFLPVLKRYSEILSNDMVSPQDVISIAWWRIIRYGKHTPKTLWVPLCIHVNAETKSRRKRASIAPMPDDSAEQKDNSVLDSLESALEGLTKLERFLLMKYYGEGYTFELLGMTLGVSWMTVRKKIMVALEKARANIGE